MAPRSRRVDVRLRGRRRRPGGLSGLNGKRPDAAWAGPGALAGSRWLPWREKRQNTWRTPAIAPTMFFWPGAEAKLNR